LEASVRRTSSFAAPAAPGHVVDRQLHLLVIALVGLRDQLVDLAVRDLGQNAIALADGQQNRVQHGVDAANNLGVGALELLRLAALGELPFFGRLGQPPHFLLQGLNTDCHIVDGPSSSRGRPCRSA
jgi:hypothetical protein